MDEPFSGLDPVNSSILRAAFLEMRDRGKTLIFSTHQMETVEALCESLVIVDRGRVVVGGPVREVKRASGRQVVRIALDGDGRADEPDWPAGSTAFPGVRVTRPGADYVELTVPREIDPQTILRAVLDRGDRVDPVRDRRSVARGDLHRAGRHPARRRRRPRPGGDDPRAGRPGGDVVSASRTERRGPGPASAATPRSSPGASIATGSGPGRSWRRRRSWPSSPIGLALAPIGLRYLDRGHGHPDRDRRRGRARRRGDGRSASSTTQLNRRPPGADPATLGAALPVRAGRPTVGDRPGGASTAAS